MLVITKSAMAGRRITQLALLLLLSSSCAWANDGTRKPERSDLRLGRRDISVEQAVSLAAVSIQPDGEPLEEINEGTREPGRQEDTSEIRTPSRHGEDVDESQRPQAKSPTAEEAAQITAPPSLNPLILQRQDNNQGQIDDLNRRLQSAQQSAQQALQSLSDASRRVSQASQQLSQSSQQLSQQSQQLSQSSQQLSQQSQQLSQSLQQATQSIQSLTQAVSSAQSSGNSAFASCTDSASAALARASGELVSKVGDAQAQITLANVSITLSFSAGTRDRQRCLYSGPFFLISPVQTYPSGLITDILHQNQAQDQVQQAQGAAVSITQAAAAIVGTFVGSSLLTVLIVWLIIRHKRRQKDRAAAPMNTGVSSYYGGGPGAEAYGAIARDVKDAMLMSPPASGTTKIGSERARSFGGSRGNDMVTSGYGLEKEAGLGTGGGAPGAGDVQIGYARSTNYRERKAPKLSEAPPARRRENGSPGDGTATTPRTPKYEVFPKVTQPGPSPPTAVVPGARGGGGGGGGRPRPRSSIQPDYNLQDWLQTTTVSPFGTLERPGVNNNNNNSPNNTNTNANPAMAQPAARPQPKRTSEVKWPLQGSSSSEPPSRSNSNTSRDADAETEAGVAATATYQPSEPAAVVTREPAAAPRTVTVASGGAPAATRSVRVGVESMRGIGLPGVARKLPLRNP